MPVRLMLIVVGVAFHGRAPVAGAVDAPTPPNLIYIMADDLGYGDLGCFGQKMIKTPRRVTASLSSVHKG